MCVLIHVGPSSTGNLISISISVTRKLTLDRAKIGRSFGHVTFIFHPCNSDRTVVTCSREVSGISWSAARHRSGAAPPPLARLIRPLHSPISFFPLLALACLTPPPPDAARPPQRAPPPAAAPPRGGSPAAARGTHHEGARWPPRGEPAPAVVLLLHPAPLAPAVPAPADHHGLHPGGICCCGRRGIFEWRRRCKRMRSEATREARLLCLPEGRQAGGCQGALLLESP